MTQAELSPASRRGSASAHGRPSAQALPLEYEVDPFWPKMLPKGWILGQCPGVAVDAFDHIVVCNRQDITEEEAEQTGNNNFFTSNSGFTEGFPVYTYETPRRFILGVSARF